MHEGGGVDEFDDDCEIEVARPDIPRGTAREEHERGPEPLAVGFDGVCDVTLHCRIERARLEPDALFDRVELGIDELERGLEGRSFVRVGFEIRGWFHRAQIRRGGIEVNARAPLAEIA